MNFINKGTEPTIEGLNQLDTAVLMHKYTILLGMIVYGTPEQKTQAKKEVEELEKMLPLHLNSESFSRANSQLDFSEDELETINNLFIQQNNK